MAGQPSRLRLLTILPARPTLPVRQGRDWRCVVVPAVISFLAESVQPGNRADVELARGGIGSCLDCVGRRHRFVYQSGRSSAVGSGRTTQRWLRGRDGTGEKERGGSWDTDDTDCTEKN